MTPREVADYLGIKLATLSRWRMDGNGPPYSVGLGRLVRYRRGDVEAFLSAGMVQNGVEAKNRRIGLRPPTARIQNQKD
jgi:excisionase family DNA binding protein